MNGRVAAADGGGFTVTVEQSFGNCAQYIQTREAMPVPRGPLRTESLSGLDTRARDAIDAADTLFVASASAAGLDMSHRGGRPGFVRQDGEVLTIPDFSGNRYFNTLGNFALNPRAALLIPDFASGDVLHLSGTVEIVWDGEEVRQFAGAERLWRFTLRAAERRISALPPRWSDPAYSPSLAGTGIWREGATQTGIRAPSAPPSLSTPVVSP